MAYPGLSSLFGIDPASATEVRDAVLTVQAETAATMLVVEHRVELWIDHIDRVIVLGAAAGVALHLVGLV